MTARTVEDPVFRHRLRFEEATDEAGAPVVHCEMWVDPGGGVPPHVHPAMDERFTVIDGRAEFLAGRSWRGAYAGETVVVPAGTRHAYRNRGAEVAHVLCVASPPDPGLEGFLTDAAALARAGHLGRWGVPKTLTGLLQGALMLERYRGMVEVGFPPMPPRPLQRMLLPPLARLAHRRAERPGALGG